MLFVFLNMYKSEYQFEYRSQYRARSIFGSMLILSCWSCRRPNTDLNIDLNTEPSRYSRRLWFSSFWSCLRAITDLNIEPGRYSGKCWHCLSCRSANTHFNIDANIEPGRYSGKCRFRLSDHVEARIPTWIRYEYRARLIFDKMLIWSEYQF